MALSWQKDPDGGLASAKQQDKPALLDFSAAPMWAGCARLEAEVYPDPRVSEFISTNFIPVKIHVKEQPDAFKRFGAPWTPTQLIMSPDGLERHRIEGFLPVDDFLAQLHLGLGFVYFQKQDFSTAERWFRSVYEKFAATSAAPEGMYWAGVSRYKATGNGEDLTAAGKMLDDKYPQSEWARKGSVWLPQRAK